MALAMAMAMALVMVLVLAMAPVMALAMAIMAMAMALALAMAMALALAMVIEIFNEHNEITVMAIYRESTVMRNAIKAWETMNPYDDELPEPHCCMECGTELENPEHDICFKCWHLENLGEVKAQIQLWFNQGFSAEKIIDVMNRGDEWFYNMTESTVNRWCNIIEKLGNNEQSN